MVEKRTYKYLLLFLRIQRWFYWTVNKTFGMNKVNKCEPLMVPRQFANILINSMNFTYETRSHEFGEANMHVSMETMHHLSLSPYHTNMFHSFSTTKTWLTLTLVKWTIKMWICNSIRTMKINRKKPINWVKTLPFSYFIFACCLELNYMTGYNK